MVRVVLGGPGLDGFEMPAATDAYVNVAIPPAGAPYDAVFEPRAVREAHPEDVWPARRRYTVRTWDEASRRLTLDFVVHGDDGVAGPWAAAVAPGDVLVFEGPGSGYRPDPTADWHLLVGDESALPAIAASLEALRREPPVVVRLVCDGPEHEVPLDSAADVDLQWLHRTGDAERMPACSPTPWRPGLPGRPGTGVRARRGRGDPHDPPPPAHRARLTRRTCRARRTGAAP